MGSLRLERPSEANAGDYARLFADPGVAGALWPGELGGPRTPEQAGELLTRDVAHWAALGFGPWACFAAEGFVARGGLQSTDTGGRPSVEVLYSVVSEAWGRGHATAIARAAVAHARELGLPEVVGFALTTNRASVHVLEKAGLRYEGEIEHAGRPHWLGRLALR
jgi:RimJ/RimL family protein N-acetyltransferase